MKIVPDLSPDIEIETPTDSHDEQIQLEIAEAKWLDRQDYYSLAE